MTDKTMIEKSFWKDKKVFITGHTGFKGSWLCLWLHSLGADIIGYALAPPTEPNLYELCKIDRIVHSIIGDVRDLGLLTSTLSAANPEIVIHMAAQSLVRESYRKPAETYSVNVMGTITLFEALRKCKSVRAIINVTTDKCYENREWCWGYRESEPLGGFDPYSNSKACSELVTSAYRSSFFVPEDYNTHGVGIASARSGNVMGGGDWAADRLIPDCVRSILKGDEIIIRNPQAVRPWQHLLDPLNGYLMLAEKLHKRGPYYGEAWNFGPDDRDTKNVEWIVNKICTKWGRNASYTIDKGQHPHEAQYLRLDCSKAKSKLGWYPKWNLEQALERVIEWVRAYQNGENVGEICRRQLEAYEGTENDIQR
jgi:CDP-glucose 4,6-dehydratase